MLDYVGVGIIGCGWITEAVHLPTLAGIPGVRVEAVCDRLDERRAVAARFFPGATGYPDMRGVLADPKLTAVIVALPPVHNRRVVEAALAAGKDVYVEKPLSLTSEDAEAIVAAWRKTRQIVMVGYNFRVSPVVITAIDMIRRGEIGDVVGIQGRFTWQAQGVSGWRADVATSGGVLADLGSHHIDLATLLARAPVTEVAACVRSLHSQADTADMSLGFANGVQAQIHVGTAAGANANVMTVTGTDGALVVDLLEPRLWPPIRGDAGRTRSGRLAMAYAAIHPLRLLAGSGREPSFRASLEVFLAACRTRLQPAPDPFDGSEVVRVVAAGRASAESGCQRCPVRGHP